MSPEHRAVARFYITLYMVPAVTVTYLPIWLENRGLTGGEIGSFTSLPLLAMLLFSVFFGRLADRAKDWKQAITLGHGLAFLATMPLFFAAGWGYWPLLALWMLSGVPAGLVGPVGDAASMRLSRRKGFSFGQVRGLGTVGFLAICLVTGWAAARWGDDAFLWLLVVAAGLRFWHSARLPPMREAGAARPSGKGRVLSAELLGQLSLWVLLPLIGGAVIFATHMVMNAFSALVWKGQGISEGTIGLLIAIGAGAEALSMLAWGKVETRFSARTLVLMAALAACLRWGVMAFAPPVWVLVPLQLLQGVTFTGSLLGCLYFIANRTDERVAAEAQSLFGVMQQGGSVLIIAAFGLLYGQIGALAFLASAFACALVVPMIWASLRLQGSEDRVEAPAE
ncbi:MFS transporter [Pseudoroseicyclus sp. CXY001]|uniref:MFS transporter n=1 Tax=Pseudoroseicyclus sp. CXY001 TaxID=3242492 RepID=UPI0035717443